MSSSAALAFRRVLADNPEVESCLREFCAKERNYQVEHSRAALLQPVPDHHAALRFAHQSQVYETWMSEFEHFLKNEVRNVEVV